MYVEDACGAVERDANVPTVTSPKALSAGQVKDAIKHVEAAGGRLDRTRGSHRQYRHPKRPGLVTIAGKPSDTLHPKTWASTMKQAGTKDS